MCTIYIEIIIRHILTKGDRSTPVISQMEDPGLDTQPDTISKPKQATDRYIPSKVSSKSHRDVSNEVSKTTNQQTGTNVFPLAGRPTVMITIRPEWKSRPDSVLYNWAGARSAFSGRSWIASTNVDDFRRKRGELATMSAVLDDVSDSAGYIDW